MVDGIAPSQPAAAAPGPRRADGRPLSGRDAQALRQMQQRDREVRSHEAMHQAVGGSLAGPASFDYRSGPDGRRYAVSGEVPIDTAPERELRATIIKMQRVIDAALAPPDPSAQDQSVAVQAQGTMARAQSELSRVESEEARAAARRAHERADGYLLGWQGHRPTGQRIDVIV
jgi:hypothetical protein